MYIGPWQELKLAERMRGGTGSRGTLGQAGASTLGGIVHHSHGASVNSNQFGDANGGSGRVDARIDEFRESLKVALAASLSQVDAANVERVLEPLLAQLPSTTHTNRSQSVDYSPVHETRSISSNPAQQGTDVGIPSLQHRKRPRHVGGRPPTHNEHGTGNNHSSGARMKTALPPRSNRKHISNDAYASTYKTGQLVTSQSARGSIRGDVNGHTGGVWGSPRSERSAFSGDVPANRDGVDRFSNLLASRRVLGARVSERKDSLIDVTAAAKHGTGSGVNLQHRNRSSAVTPRSRGNSPHSSHSVGSQSNTSAKTENTKDTKSISRLTGAEVAASSTYDSGRAVAVLKAAKGRKTYVNSNNITNSYAGNGVSAVNSRKKDKKNDKVDVVSEQAHARLEELRKMKALYLAAGDTTSHTYTHTNSDTIDIASNVHSVAPPRANASEHNTYSKVHTENVSSQSQPGPAYDVYTDTQAHNNNTNITNDVYIPDMEITESVLQRVEKYFRTGATFEAAYTTYSNGGGDHYSTPTLHTYNRDIHVASHTHDVNTHVASPTQDRNTHVITTEPSLHEKHMNTHAPDSPKGSPAFASAKQRLHRASLLTPVSKFTPASKFTMPAGADDSVDALVQWTRMLDTSLGGDWG